MFEEYWRGTLSGAVEYFKSKEARGEFTLVIEGEKKEERGKWKVEDLQAAIEKESRGGKSAKALSAELSERSGWSKKDVYRLVSQKGISDES